MTVELEKGKKQVIFKAHVGQLEDQTAKERTQVK